MDDPDFDPRLRELAALIREILGEWRWLRDRRPDLPVGPPEPYMTKIEGYVERGDLAAALALARRDRERLVWPCILPIEAGIDEHGRPLPKQADHQEPAP